MYFHESLSPFISPSPMISLSISFLYLLYLHFSSHLYLHLHMHFHLGKGDMIPGTYMHRATPNFHHKWIFEENKMAAYMNSKNCAAHHYICTTSIAGHRHRGRCRRHRFSGILYLNPVPEHSDTELGPFIEVSNWFRVCWGARPPPFTICTITYKGL